MKTKALIIGAICMIVATITGCQTEDVHPAIKRHVDDAFSSIIRLIMFCLVCLSLVSCNPIQAVMFNGDGTPKGLVQGGGLLSKAKNVAMKFKKGDIEVTTVIGSAETDGTIAGIATAQIAGNTTRIIGAQKVVDNANKRPNTIIPGTKNVKTLPDGTTEVVETPATAVPPPKPVNPPY